MRYCCCFSLVGLTNLFYPSTWSELLDTFFIVIHKKPLIFLHWYHHISVLLYCWHAYVTKAPAGLFFVTMNYGVHAIMYFYYFLMAIKCKPKWFNSIWITVSQISQMVVGVTVTVLGFVLGPKYEKECAIKPENNAAALIMYGSYLLLFVQFFVQRYQVKGSKKSKSKKTDWALFKKLLHKVNNTPCRWLICHPLHAHFFWGQSFQRERGWCNLIELCQCNNGIWSNCK